MSSGGGCVYPECPRQVTGTNRYGQPTCTLHLPVAVSGSYVGDRHDKGGAS